jgi:hypothetical protein
MDAEDMRRSSRLEHSDDRNYRCGGDYYNCEKNIQQINRGDVIYVVFDGRPFLSTPIRSPKSAPKKKKILSTH